jgi:hypothetical protein
MESEKGSVVDTRLLPPKKENFTSNSRSILALSPVECYRGYDASYFAPTSR